MFDEKIQKNIDFLKLKIKQVYTKPFFRPYTIEPRFLCRCGNLLLVNINSNDQLDCDKCKKAISSSTIKTILVSVYDNMRHVPLLKNVDYKIFDLILYLNHADMKPISYTFGEFRVSKPCITIKFNTEIKTDLFIKYLTKNMYNNKYEINKNPNNSITITNSESSKTIYDFNTEGIKFFEYITKLVMFFNKK